MQDMTYNDLPLFTDVKPSINTYQFISINRYTFLHKKPYLYSDLIP
jgi:hypothetical protein